MPRGISILTVLGVRSHCKSVEIRAFKIAGPVPLYELSSRKGSTFEVHRVRAGDKALREPMTFDRVRDELAHQLYLWMKQGGALIEDEQLETELHALEWERGVTGHSKITPKKNLRKALGRSPDSYDVTALNVWPVLSDAEIEEDEDGDDFDDEGHGHFDRIDPYANDDIDPYGAW